LTRFYDTTATVRIGVDLDERFCGQHCLFLHIAPTLPIHASCLAFTTTLGRTYGDDGFSKVERCRECVAALPSSRTQGFHWLPVRVDVAAQNNNHGHCHRRCPWFSGTPVPHCGLHRINLVPAGGWTDENHEQVYDRLDECIAATVPT
jgi:hypothetical protein